MEKMQWYGLRVGDKISFVSRVGIVASLSPVDNNRGMMMDLDSGQLMLISCRHCELLAEDNPREKKVL